MTTTPVRLKTSKIMMFFNRNLQSICWLAIGLILCGGCGGGKKPMPQPVAANANPAPPVPGNVVGVPNASLKPLNSKQTGPESASHDAEPPSQDDFVLSDDQIITEIEGPKPQAPPVPFEVSPLVKGLDSTNLVIASVSSGTGGPQEFQSTANDLKLPGAAPLVDANNNSTTGRNPTSTVPTETLTLPKGFAALPGVENNPDTNLPLRIRGERDAVEMILIAPGVFLRGADVSDPSVSPRHTVLMEHAYYIDATEVTVGQYNAFREFYRKTEGRKLDAPTNHDANPDLPAVGIKFFDAKYYAKWAGKELPTETQWERAARGDRGLNFPWGDGRPVFHLPRTTDQLDPVGTFPGDRTPLGVYDMAGNAREWCLDLFQADVYKKELALGGGTVRDPVGPKSASGTKQQVVRGGNSDWAVWHRSAMPQNETEPDIGFRCVLNIASLDQPESGKKPKDKKNTAKF